MPSESTKRCSGSTILKQSSLLERTRPTSVTPPLAIRTRTPLPPEITPLPTPIPGDSVPTLTEPQGPRKPLNPTDYSLFGDTQARWVSSRIDPVLLSHREVLHYNSTHVFAPLVLTFFLLVCRIFLCAASSFADGPLRNLWKGFLRRRRFQSSNHCGAACDSSRFFAGFADRTSSAGLATRRDRSGDFVWETPVAAIFRDVCRARSRSRLFPPETWRASGAYRAGARDDG